MKERLKAALRRMLYSRVVKEEGVTLIELLAVVVILGVIAAIAVPIIGDSITKSKVNTTKQNMAIIAQALARYAGDHDGKYPTSDQSHANGDDISETYTASAPASVTALQQYLQGIPTDGWGQDYYYTSTDGTHFQLKTAKAAGVPQVDPSDEGFTITDTQSTPN